jgi:hypothetical protein
MSDVNMLRQKAQVLRNELKEIEAAIAVFERHASGKPIDFSALVSPREEDRPAPSDTLGSVDDILKWLANRGAGLSCRTALIGLLRGKTQGMSKQDLRQGLKALGVEVEDSTLTWTLATYDDAFDNFERGMYRLKPGSHL